MLHTLPNAVYYKADIDIMYTIKYGTAEPLLKDDSDKGHF